MASIMEIPGRSIDDGRMLIFFDSTLSFKLHDYSEMGSIYLKSGLDFP